MTDPNIVQLGDPMPVIGAVAAISSSAIWVSWAEGDRAGREEKVDLAPLIFTLKFYRNLRDNEALFRTVHLIADGAALAWGDDEAIDMAATSVERLAAEAMTPADFKGFLERNSLTLDAAAAQLGISRRLVAYYTSGKEVPRYIALACKYLDYAERDRLEVAVNTENEVCPVSALPASLHAVPHRFFTAEPCNWVMCSGEVGSYQMTLPSSAQVLIQDASSGAFNPPVGSLKGIAMGAPTGVGPTIQNKRKVYLKKDKPRL